MGWLNLEGKVAIVTGGACGIGRAVCEGLAEVGAKVVVADVNAEGAQKSSYRTEWTVRWQLYCCDDECN